MTLIPLLKAIRYVLDQERLNKSAEEISKVGAELYGEVGRQHHWTEIWQWILSPQFPPLTRHRRPQQTVDPSLIALALRFQPSEDIGV